MKTSTFTRRFGPRRIGSLALALLALALTAAGNPRVEPLDIAWTRAIINFDEDPADSYLHTLDGNGVHVAAPSANRGGNLREALIRNRTRASFDHESCVTWHGPVADSAIQPGVVLRARSENGRVRLIMVTNNVWAGLRSTVNIHLVDTAWEKEYRQVAGHHTESVGAHEAAHPLPWRFCARVMGDLVQAKGWSVHNPEPVWDDQTAVVSTTLPSDYIHRGHAGVYLGHLRPGEETLLTDHTVQTFVGEPEAAVHRVEQLVRMLSFRPATTAPWSNHPAHELQFLTSLELPEEAFLVEASRLARRFGRPEGPGPGAGPSSTDAGDR